MIGVQVHIVRFAYDTQPGIVECHLVDAHGRCWSFHEKVPVVTLAPLDEQLVQLLEDLGKSDPLALSALASDDPKVGRAKEISPLQLRSRPLPR